MNNPIVKKLSLLSISLFLMSHLAIAPAIPKLFKYYHTHNPHIGLASVESLVTLPAMMITLFVIISNLVVAKLGQKKNSSARTDFDLVICSYFFFLLNHFLLL